MVISDIFSKRQKKLRGENPDVYVYDVIPHALRVQILHLWNETIGRGDAYEYLGHSAAVYESIVKLLRREYGVFKLPCASVRSQSYVEELTDFFLNVEDTEQAIDIIELTFDAINTVARQYPFSPISDPSLFADPAIEELNARFREHGVGYHFANGSVIRIDSELIHSEVVKPALRLLTQKQYAGAEQEFLKAHEHYRQGNAKEALNESLKAFESLMTAICDKRGWTYGTGDTAKALIAICYEKGLIPVFWQGHFGAIRALLEGGIPTGRNRLSAHGQGTSATSVPNYLVAYMLHMTAAAMVCLAEAEANLP